MKLLIDTHILLWHLAGNPKLSTEKSALIEDPENIKYFSIASLWEIAIKQSIGKLTISQDFDSIIPIGIKILNIKITHINIVKNLDFYHKDPFDRLLIAQAMSENLTILTDDHYFSKYKVAII